MPSDDQEMWLDEKAGPLIRPYAVAKGRTEPSQELDLVSQVVATGRTPKDLALEHAQVLELCHPQRPAEVFEIAGRVGLPVIVTKVLLADLIEEGAVTLADAWVVDDPHDVDVLEELLRGLHAI